MWDFLAIAGVQRAGARRAFDMNSHAVPIEKIPRKIPQTNPTSPDESDTTGQVFLQIRMNPTSPDHSDRLQPPHNPSVVGSIPTGPTCEKFLSLNYLLWSNVRNSLATARGRLP
jgi:hypothetical protein